LNIIFYTLIHTMGKATEHAQKVLTCLTDVDR
jgi:hypothetical protein